MFVLIGIYCKKHLTKSMYRYVLFYDCFMYSGCFINAYEDFCYKFY